MPIGGVGVQHGVSLARDHLGTSHDGGRGGVDLGEDLRSERQVVPPGRILPSQLIAGAELQDLPAPLSAGVDLDLQHLGAAPAAREASEDAHALRGARPLASLASGAHALQHGVDLVLAGVLEFPLNLHRARPTVSHLSRQGDVSDEGRPLMTVVDRLGGKAEWMKQGV